MEQYVAFLAWTCSNDQPSTRESAFHRGFLYAPRGGGFPNQRGRGLLIAGQRGRGDLQRWRGGGRRGGRGQISNQGQRGAQGGRPGGDKRGQRRGHGGQRDGQGYILQN
ncbi:rRNA 2'-O-methyltransferase fibrillarin [Copidosoma floridanum]|uniref:rRNA 2'-O-methyltransferase fibrillarin n=1 Tax=Copidosoma floridanum TaxID=29053 RepID=UPI0006C9AD42|nr:rRNA 2'-O-methyltransferase fibrillarin [Copidosoma floridanum]